MTSPANATAASNATTGAKEGCRREKKIGQNSGKLDLSDYAEHARGSTNPLAGLGAGDSSLHFHISREDESTNVFPTPTAGVDWSHMCRKAGPVPRLVAMQGEISPANYEPIWCDPLDHHLDVLPFTPTADTPRARVQACTGLRANHALIQLYRTPEDHIGEHADNTLDIGIGSVIDNLSCGATLVFTLRTKSKVSVCQVQELAFQHAGAGADGSLVL